MASKDPRFAKLGSDPRFIRPSRAAHKVELDDRFKSLLERDPEFGGAGEGDRKRSNVDKYGRKVAKNKGSQDLKAFYKLDDARSRGPDRARGEGLIESSSEEDDEDEQADGTIVREEQDEDDDDDDSESSDDDQVVLGSDKRRKQGHRRRRSAASDEELLVDLDEDVPTASTSAQRDGQSRVESAIPTMEDSTRRIALVNLDWDNVRAIDLFKVFDSVLSASASGLVEAAGSRKSKTKIGKGRVESVKIYPSEFGKARLAREEKEGPPMEIFGPAKGKGKAMTTSAVGPSQSSINTSKKMKKSARPADTDEDDFSDDDNGEEYDEQALRRYQLERLRYHYAVVEFDTEAAARHAYEEIDGTEFEATANIFDLRYVPEDTTFDDQPTDVATSASVSMQAYKPAEFVTDALRNSKVKLTWDADDPQRTKLTKAAHTGNAKGKDKEEEVDYSALIASDSEDEGDRRARLRAAFGLDANGAADGEEEDSDQEMEVTFAPALSGGLNDRDSASDGEKEETSLEAYQRKERERRQAKKEKKRAERKKLAGGKGRLTHDDEADSDPDEAFDANQFESAGDEEDGRDAFFHDDLDVSGSSEGEAEPERPPTDAQKVSKKAAKQLEKERRAKEAEALSLLVDDEEGGSDEGRHFDMQAILRAEKISSKPKKSLKKGKDRRKHKEASELLDREKDKFEVDLKDDRFKNLHDDYEFALDPSNPKYMKTKNMQRLLEESRRRRTSAAPDEDELRRPIGGKPTGEQGQATKGLESLVDSIKRKSQQQKIKTNAKRQKT